MSEFETCGPKWSKAVGYAMAQSVKKWRESGHEGEPSFGFLKEWVPYYLAQQWGYTMPPGGMYS